MAVLDAGVSVVAAALRKDVVVERYWDDMTIRSLIKAKRLDWKVEPDSLIVLCHGTIRRAYFLEIDRGSESVASPRENSWETKMGKYKYFFQVTRQTDPYLSQLPQPKVLTICHNPGRYDNLKRVTGNVGGRSAYGFTHAEYTLPPYSFFDQVWEFIAVPGYHSILEDFSS